MCVNKFECQKLQIGGNDAETVGGKSSANTFTEMIRLKHCTLPHSTVKQSSYTQMVKLLWSTGVVVVVLSSITDITDANLGNHETCRDQITIQQLNL